MNCIDFTSKRSKMFSYVPKHSKLRKTTKVFILQWIASILHQNDLKCSVTSQNIQNYAKLQKWSNYNELHRFDVKTFKTMQNYKTDQITMNCIDWMSKRSKQRKTTKQNKLQLIASIVCQNDRNKAKLQKWSKSNDLNRFDVKTFKTKQIYKTDQITMNCIDWMSKRSKQRKTTKQNKLQLIASIVCQNDRNKAKLQKWSKSNDLNRFDVKTFKTKQIYKTDQITMNCIDWMSKRSKQS